MLIRMKTLACGPTLRAEPGDIIDHEDGQAMVDAGHAEPVEQALIEQVLATAQEPGQAPAKAKRARTPAAQRETR